MGWCPNWVVVRQMRAARLAAVNGEALDNVHDAGGRAPRVSRNALVLGYPGPSCECWRRACGHNAPQFSRTVLRDSCSAWLTISQRLHALGSINSVIAFLTQARSSFGSIASNSQQRFP